MCISIYVHEADRLRTPSLSIGEFEYSSQLRMYSPQISEKTIIKNHGKACSYRHPIDYSGANCEPFKLNDLTHIANAN